MYNGVWGKAPRSREIFNNFCVKSNVKVCKVTFNCKLQKKIGEQDVLVVPPIILLGSTCSPAPPVLVPMVNCAAMILPL